MKMIQISRKTGGVGTGKNGNGFTFYKTRAPGNTDERELALQQDCVAAIKASIKGCNDKSQAEEIAKLILSASAAVHSDLERILRQHGSKKPEEVK